MEDNPLNPPSQSTPPLPTPPTSSGLGSPADGGVGLPDPSGMGLGVADGGPSKKGNPKAMIIMVVVGVFLVLIIVAVIIVASNNSSKKQAQTLGQYQAGYDAGVKEQKQASEKEYIEKTSKDFRIYRAASEFGSFEIPIPNPWSLSITPKEKDGTFTGWASPEYVDSTVKQQVFIFEQKKGNYDKIIADFNKQAEKSAGKIKVSDATVSGITGKRFKGLFDEKTKAKAEVIIVPLREKYFLFRTDDPDKYSEAFNNILNNTKLNP